MLGDLFHMEPFVDGKGNKGKKNLSVNSFKCGEAFEIKSLAYYSKSFCKLEPAF